MECRLIRFYVIHTLNNIDFTLQNWLVQEISCNVEKAYAIGPVRLVGLPDSLDPNVSATFLI